MEIKFPKWVGEPTPCKTRTFSVVLPRDARYNPHGTIRIVTSFPNRPVVKRPRIGLPGFYYGWADQHVWNCPTVRKAPGLENVRCNCEVEL
jgi:hypothetical protein